MIETAQLLFDKLAYVDRLKSGGISDDQARVHAEALDAALRDSVVTRQALENAVQRLAAKIDTQINGLALRGAGALIVLFGALASIKFFG